MADINSYPTVYNLGHKAIDGIFRDPVYVEEKIDGSQFSFGLIGGELVCRSKGKQLILDAPEKMFIQAIESVKQRQHLLHPGWVYRCEYVQKTKHNVLIYDRVPSGFLIGFDVAVGEESYLPYSAKQLEFERINLETVPLLFHGTVPDVDTVRGFLDTISVLGGNKVEGVVVKNYQMFTAEKKVAIGKYVSEAFKEVAGGEWRKANPTGADLVTQLVTTYRTPARWQKAVQHLRDAGELQDSPKDIGPLMKEVNKDVLKEEEEAIKTFLFKYFWPKISRGLTAGLPEWYKQLLLEGAFTNLEESEE